jgi:hypothetical protein
VDDLKGSSAAFVYIKRPRIIPRSIFLGKREEGTGKRWDCAINDKIIGRWM